jgi:hypothetical protein
LLIDWGGLQATGGGTVDIESNGTTVVRGNLVKLNNGSLPVARSGDLVIVPGASPGTITNGSPTVLA